MSDKKELPLSFSTFVEYPFNNLCRFKSSLSNMVRISFIVKKDEKAMRLL